LKDAIGEWQSAILYGLIGLTHHEEGAEPEPELKLCLTIDAYSGSCFQAPTNAVRRFHNAEAACQTIAEQWANIEPPTGAIV
jgi:hypothetical protein